MQLVFSDRENVDHSPASLARVACSFLTQAVKVKSGPPVSDGLSACWAIPRHTGLTLRLGILCGRAGQTTSSTIIAETSAIHSTRIGSPPIVIATLLGVTSLMKLASSLTDDALHVG